MEAEGWYCDPFERHVDRRFSDDRPRQLVRDDGVESHDPPPDSEITQPLVPSVETGATDGSDLMRADEQQPFRKRGFIRAVLDVLDQTSHTQ